MFQDHVVFWHVVVLDKGVNGYYSKHNVPDGEVVREPVS